MALFTPQDLQKLPSCSDNDGQILTTVQEAIARVKQIRHIFRMCYQLKLPYTVRYTACVYFHIYCFRRSFSYYDISSISAACIYLASKTEEQRRSVRDVAETAFYYTKNRKAPNPSEDSRYANDHKKLLDQLQDAELLLMQTLEFNFEISQPYGYLNIIFTYFKSIYCGIDDCDNKNNNNNNSKNGIAPSNMAFDIDKFEFGDSNESNDFDERPKKRRRLNNDNDNSNVGMKEEKDDNNNNNNNNNSNGNDNKNDGKIKKMSYWALRLHFQYAWMFVRDFLKIAECVMFSSQHIAIICVELALRYVVTAFEEQKKNEKIIDESGQPNNRSQLKHLKSKHKTDILPKNFTKEDILNPSLNWYEIFDRDLTMESINYAIDQVVLHMENQFFHKNHLKRERECEVRVDAVDEHCLIYETNHSNDFEKLDILNGKSNVQNNNVGLSMTGRNDAITHAPNQFSIPQFIPGIARYVHRPTIIQSSLQPNVSNIHNQRYSY